MKRNPRLQLPEDPNVNIWNYYPIMKVAPVVMDDFLRIILTIPLTDQSLEMNLYKIYNLPALHPELKVEFTYELEGEYLAITKNKLYDIKPPLTIVYVGDGCEAYSNNLFIPAKSELTSTNNSLVRHNYLQKFNEEYQDITRYSLIEDLGIVQLTSKEIAKIPDRLMALPKFQFKELKRRFTGN